MEEPNTAAIRNNRIGLDHSQAVEIPDINMILSIDQLNSTYERRAVIGKGGFGQVYRWQKIKGVDDTGSLPEKLAVKEVDLENSLEEVEILLKINHENAVKCYGCFPMLEGDKSSSGMIVMELCDGSLRDLISAKTLRDYELSRLLKQMLEGVDCLHDNGIIHRDIKPSNFLLSIGAGEQSFDWRRINTSRMTIKLADFGCSRELKGTDSRDTALTTVGTMGYFPPEVMEGFKDNRYKVLYSRKSDIWSIGMVAYQCAMGMLPGVKGGEVQLIELAETGERSQLCNFLQKIFHKDIDKRASAQELLNHAFITDVDSHYKDIIPCIQTDERDHLRQLISEFEVIDFETGSHPLDVAVNFNRLECLQMLLEEGQVDIGRGSQLLITAVSKDLQSIIEYLLLNQVDVNEADATGDTPLMIACKTNNHRAIHLLAHQNGIDANIADNHSKTALHEAVLRCSPADIECILENTNADVNHADTNGQTVFMSAAAKGSLDMVKLLAGAIECDVDKTRNIYGQTALHYACQNGKVTTLDYLINEMSANPVLTNKNNSSLLHQAVVGDELEMVKHLLKKYYSESDLNLRDQTGKTPLHCVCHKGNLEIAKCLVESSADINAVDIYERTTLHLACIGGFTKIVKYLAENPLAKINLPDVDSCRPLHLACTYGHIEIVDYLVSFSSTDVLKRNRYGQNCLHITCNMGHPNIAHLLIKRQPALLVPDFDGDTILHYACERNNERLARYIISQNLVNINHLNNEKETALHYACKQGNTVLVKLLLKRTNVEQKSRPGKTAKDMAEMHGHDQVVDFLEKYLAKTKTREEGILDQDSVLDTKSHGTEDMLELLHMACENDDLDLVKSIMAPNFTDLCHLVNPLGLNLIHVASKYGKGSILRWVIEAGAPSSALCARDNRLGYTPLHYAVHYSQLEAMRCLVEMGKVDVDLCDHDKITPLHIACYMGRLDILSYLVEKAGADINKRSKPGEAAIHVATDGGRLPIIKYLCSLSLDVLKSTDQYKRTPLHVACTSSTEEVVKYIFTSLPECQLMPDDRGKMPIHDLATDDKKFKILRCLIEECHCDPNVKNLQNKDILQLASENNCLLMASYLVEENIMTASTAEKFQNCIGLAISNGNFHLVKHLVETFPNEVNKRDNSGFTPLLTASKHGQLDVVKHLLNVSGADRMVKDLEGNMDIHIAAWYGQLEIVKFLVEEHFSDVNIATYKEWTPLLFACGRGHLHISKYLLEVAKAERTAKDRDGNMGVHLAVQQGHNDIVEYLIETRPADVDEVDNAGLAAGHMACLNGDIGLVTILVEREKPYKARRDKIGRLEIHHACEKGHLAVVEYLLQQIPDVLSSVSDHQTAIDLANMSGNAKLAEFLNSLKGNIKFKSTSQVLTAKYPFQKGFRV